MHPARVQASSADFSQKSQSAQAQDTQHCSNATMHGSYGFHATGKGFVAIGRFLFDGNGGLAGKLFVRVPGTNIGPLEIAGTYSVGPDCIMTDDWGGGNVHISAIVDQGKGYFIMNVTPSTPDEDGLNNMEEGRRQSPKKLRGPILFGPLFHHRRFFSPCISLSLAFLFGSFSGGFTFSTSAITDGG